MGPEAPFLASGLLLFLAGIARQGGLPKEMGRFILGVVALGLFASAAENTKVAPLVRAIGLLFLLSSGMLAVSTMSDAAQKRKAKK